MAKVLLAISSPLYYSSRGIKLAWFVSPHYKDYRERIKINGRYITKPFVTKFVGENIQKFRNINASFFEITTAMASNILKKKKLILP